MFGLDILSETAAAQLPPLTLAYIGDCVFELYVRTKLTLKGTGNAGTLHRESVGIVNARAQAEFAHGVENALSERERDVFRRGRNAKSGTAPKNMSVVDYRYATAVEAVVGYLYLSGQDERLEEILNGLDI